VSITIDGNREIKRWSVKEERAFDSVVAARIMLEMIGRDIAYNASSGEAVRFSPLVRAVRVLQRAERRWRWAVSRREWWETHLENGEQQ
jgi:hypothetical protein